ncbi:MAG: site-specific DNA-methyltransferase, partial [Chloroflexi bacterium]
MVIKKTDEGYTVLMKDRIKEGRKPKTIWSDSKYDASTHGTVLLEKIFGETKMFSYPKALDSVLDALSIVTKEDRDAIIVDLFGGSGT